MPAWVRRISEVSYGIFFIHGFFVEGLQWISDRSGWPLDPGPATAVLIALSFALSWLACEILRRVPRLRGLVS